MNNDTSSHVRYYDPQTDAPSANLRHNSDRGTVLNSWPSRRFPFLEIGDAPFHVAEGEEWNMDPLANVRQANQQSSPFQTWEISPSPSPPSRAAPCFRSTRHPLYHGIRSRSGKWVTEIREPGKNTRIWLGTYKTPEMAAVAFDVAAFALKGEGAVLNFPDSVRSNPVPASGSASDIRAASAAAAAARLPKQGDDGTSSAERSGGEGEEFVDEEALFSMPMLLENMAEGLLISPPRSNSPEYHDPPANSDEESLWSYR